MPRTGRAAPWLRPLTALVVIAGGPAALLEAPADVVLVNARIFTGDAAHPWAEALAVRRDRIAWVGTWAEIEARFAGARRVIDVQGRTVIPGINDAHLHAPEVWHPVEARRPPGSPSPQEILAAVAEAAAAAPEGAWIHADLGIAALDDPQFGRGSLDGAAPRHPVLVDNFAGHATILNTRALHLLGIREASRPPAGGYYGRDRAGRLDGRVDEYARWIALRRLGSSADSDTVARRAIEFSAEAARYGITTVQNMSDLVDAERLADILRRNPPPIRWRIIRFPLHGVERAAAGTRQAGDLVSVSGTKYILDGTPVERGAAMILPYSDRPGWSGRLNFSRADIRRMLSQALESGQQLHLHIAGDRALKAVLDGMEATAGPATWRRHRLAVEHGDALGAGELERARRLGIILVQNPSHFTLASLMQRRLGPRAKRWFALRSALRAGIPVALGSDGPLNPYLNVLYATTHPSSPGEALTREEAIAAYTSGSAYDERMEAEKGKLVPGMLADLAVLSQDVFAVPPERLPETRSVLTLVGGRVAHDDLGLRP